MFFFEPTIRRGGFEASIILLSKSESPPALTLSSPPACFEHYFNKYIFKQQARAGILEFDV